MVISVSQTISRDIEYQGQAYWDFMTQEEREKYAWLAGIIDGEGAIFMSKRKRRDRNYQQYDLILRIEMNSESTIRRVKEIASVGRTYRDSSRPSRYKTGYIWVAYDHEAASVTRHCLPFLCTKKRHAEIALAFINARSLVTGKGARKELSPSLEVKWEYFFQALRQLNGRRPIRKEV